MSPAFNSSGGGILNASSEVYVGEWQSAFMMLRAKAAVGLAVLLATAAVLRALPFDAQEVVNRGSGRAVGGQPPNRLRSRTEPQRRRSPCGVHHSSFPDSRHPTSVIDDGEFLIDTNAVYGVAPGSDPAIAFDGSNYFVTWVNDQSGSSDIYGARVTQAGVVLDTAGIPISTAANNQVRPVVSFGGGSFLVVWEEYCDNSDSGDIYGARVTPTGVVLDPSGIPISARAHDQSCPALAFDGTNFLVVWQAWRSRSWDIYGARVTPEGTVLDTAGIRISGATHDQKNPAVDFDGQDFFVAWRDSRNHRDTSDIYSARVTRDGVVLDTSGIPVSLAANYQDFPALAFDGTNFLVTWGDSRYSPVYYVYGARVTPEGVLLDTSGIPICTATDYRDYSAVAFDGTDFFVTWTDWRNNNFADIYGARVTTGGTVRDPTGIPISTAAEYQEDPKLAFDGTDFLVTWTDSRTAPTAVFGARVTPGGTVLDPSGIPVTIAANDLLNPALAFDGTDFLVAWIEPHGSRNDVRGARVTPSGAVLDPSGIVICTTAVASADDDQLPTLAFDGANYLVVWTDSRNGNDLDIYGARVTPQGVVLDTSGIAVSTASGYRESPALAFDGRNFLVTWADNRWGEHLAVYGTRVTPGGVVLDPAGIRISPLWYDQYDPSIAFDGTNYLVTWTNDDDTLYSSYVYGARMNPAGTVLDSPPLQIAAKLYNDVDYSALAFDGVNYLVVWMDARDSAWNIYGTRVTPQGEVLELDPISTGPVDHESPEVAYDGTDFLVTWQECHSQQDYDLYGARVSSAGTILDSGPIVRQARDQTYPALCRGSGSNVLLVYQGWAGTVGGKPYNAKRIWGKLNPRPGVQETRKVEIANLNTGPTIIRGILRVGAWVSVCGTRPEVGLYDIGGRLVMKLLPGANDVRRLSSGVYFIQASGPVRTPVRKIVVER